MRKLDSFTRQIQARLDQLNSRERKLVSYGSVVVAAALAWFVLIEPAWMTVRQAPANQAALVDKAGQVMRAAQDLDALRAARSRVVVPESDLQTRIQQLLVEHGIAEQAMLTRSEDGNLRIEFSNAPATGFLAWLARIEAISNLKINLAEIEKTEAGLLKGYMILLPAAAASQGLAR